MTNYGLLGLIVTLAVIGGLCWLLISSDTDCDTKTGKMG